MNIHEFQAKILFKQFGIPTLPSKVVHIDDNIKFKCANYDNQKWIVKAQVHAGGRGKAGGILKANNKSEFYTTLSKLLGSRLVTNQTDEKGLPINSVLLEPIIEIESELYLALLVDRSNKRIAIIASAKGGMEIEQVALKSAGKVLTKYIHPATGIQVNQARSIGYELGLDNDQINQFSLIMMNLYDLFVSKNCNLIEINPLIIDKNKNLIALDAKINFDDNALQRHHEILDFYDHAQENESEAKAKKLELNYIKLEGDIGCIVNGAGLAMATMDLVKHNGGDPANFLDVGGGVTQKRVSEAFKIVLSDKNVKSIFVNIFGGIVRCDLIAQGILNTIIESNMQIPVIILLQGTNSLEGKVLLRGKSNYIFPVASLTEGAKKAIKLAAA